MNKKIIAIIIIILGLLLSGCMQQGQSSDAQTEPVVSDNQTNEGSIEKQDTKSEEQGKDKQNPMPAASSLLEFNLNDIKAAKLPVKEMNPEALRAVEIPYKYIDDISIDGDSIYMSVHIDSQESPARIITYDMESKTEELLFESPMKVSYQTLAVNKDWMLWRDSGNNMAMNKIYVRNRDTGEDKVIYDNEESMLIVPHLYKNYAAWVDASIPGIVLYDLNTDETRVVGKINELSFYNSFVDISDDKVLWTDSIEGKGYYILYDLVTGETTKFEVPFRYPGYAEAGQGKIYSINFQDDYHTFSDNRFGFFDMAAKSYSQLTESDISSFRVGKNSMSFLGGGSRGGSNFRLCVEHSNLTEVTVPLPSKVITDIYYSDDGRVIARQAMEKDAANTILYIIDPDKI